MAKHIKLKLCKLVKFSSVITGHPVYFIAGKSNISNNTMFPKSPSGRNVKYSSLINTEAELTDSEMKCITYRTTATMNTAENSAPNLIHISFGVQRAWSAL